MDAENCQFFFKVDKLTVLVFNCKLYNRQCRGITEERNVEITSSPIKQTDPHVSRWAV
jgi:hypothetical protein